MDVRTLLDHDPAWRPAPAEAAAWIRAAEAPDAAPELLREVRWWRAWEAARVGDWDRVTALAEEGLGETFSEREAVRLALLHCVSGHLALAEHVVAQAVQTASGEDLPRRLSEWCARDGLAEAAERFALLGRPPRR